jgi:hypothetical protein
MLYFLKREERQRLYQPHSVSMIDINTQKALNRSKEFANGAITVATFLSVTVGAILLIRNNLWRPHVTVIDVDYDKGHADLLVNGSAKEMVKSVKLYAGGDWAVRFNASTGDMNKLDRIEIVKGDVVYNVVDKKEDNTPHNIFI